MENNSIRAISSIITKSTGMVKLSFRAVTPTFSSSDVLTPYLPTLLLLRDSICARIPSSPDLKSNIENPMRLPFSLISVVRHPPALNPRISSSFFILSNIVVFPIPGDPVTRKFFILEPNHVTYRDLSVVVLRTFGASKTHELTISEPLTGTGIRGIRYALEIPRIRKIIIGDHDLASIELAQRNISRNNVEEKVVLRHMDANLLLNKLAVGKERVDVVDIDPYGAPTPFLDSAARAINKRNGLLCVTATDMPNLVGIKKETCMRKYGSVPVKTMYAHEIAMRILISSSVLAVTRQGHGARPILAHSTDHYVRVYIEILRGKEKAKQTMSKLGYMTHCMECFERKVATLFEPKDKVCLECGTTLQSAGPLWIDELADREFVRKCIDEIKTLSLGKKEEVLKLLHQIHDELEIAPAFYDLHILTKKLRMGSPPLASIINDLKNQGYRASRTHFKGTGFRTNAPTREVLEIIQQYSV